MWNALAERLIGWKSEMDQRLAAIHAEPVAPASPEWYAGMAFSPVLFSEQLGNMQLALQGKARKTAVDVVAAGRENAARPEVCAI